MTTKKKKTPTPLFHIIVFDDEGGVCAPMCWDAECPGAVCCNSGLSARVALFRDVADARRAIAVGVAYNTLRRLQGLTPNSDFDPKFRKYLKILPCTAAAAAEPKPVPSPGAKSPPFTNTRGAQ